MPLTLSTLTPNRARQKRRKRVGRGNASGHGTYSTRGVKGQKARSGGRKGLKALGLKMVLRGIPKTRGFTSPYRKSASVPLGVLSERFREGVVVTPNALVAKGIITKKESRRVKIVGNETLSRALTVKAHGFSESAVRAIIKAGGTPVVLP